MTVANITIRENGLSVTIDMKEVWKRDRTPDSLEITRVPMTTWHSKQMAILKFPGEQDVCIYEDNIDIVITALCMYKFNIAQEELGTPGYSLSPNFGVSPHDSVS